MSKRMIITLLIIAAVGVIIWYVMPSAGPGQGQQMGQPGAAPVSVLTLKTETINREEILPGRVEANRQAEIRPQVNGIITKRLFEEGSEVEQGQPLYQIDDRPYKAALSSAEANLQSATANARASEAREERFKTLLSNNTVSGQAYDDAKAEFEQAKAAISIAQAAVETARVNLDYTKVIAPISGRIGKSSVTEGALATTNQADSLAVITQLDPIYVDINQPGVDAMRLRQEIRGTDIPVRVIINRDQNIVHPEKGVLKFSDVVVDETTGSIGLRAVIPNADGSLLPGLFVHAALELGQQEVVLVPQRAAIRQPDGSLVVWVVDQNNQATPRPIVASSPYKDQWIVNQGVGANDTIIIEGYQKIAPGMTVMPSPWQAPNK